MGLKAEIKTAIGWNWSDGAIDDQRLDYAKLWTAGSGPGQAEAVWHAEERLLLEGTAETLDLTDLARTVFGASISITLLSVKALLVVSHSASTGELLIGAATTDTWSEPFGDDGDQIAVPPDSPLLLVNRQSGWAVDDANKNLKLAASGGDVIYSVVVMGTTSASASGSGSGS